MTTMLFPTEELVLAKWARGLKRSPLQEMLFATAKGDLISFAMGLPAAEFFPTELIAQACTRVLANDPRALQYEPPSKILKNHIVELMALRGVSCKAEQIFLTTGAQQGMNLLVRLLLEPEGEVLTEHTIYTGFQQAIEPFQPTVLTVPTDVKTGIDVSAVEAMIATGARPAFIYAISDGHNPVAVNMSEETRARLAGVARETNVPIVEDDPYGFLYYSDAPNLPPLKAYDDRWVFYVGSFSKVLAPGFRAGWIIVPEEMILPLSIAKEASDIDTCTLSQRVVADLLSNFDVHSHLSLLRREYKTRRDVMVQALETHFPDGARWEVPNSGIFVWVELPRELSAFDLVADAVRNEGVAYIPGQAFAVDRSDRRASHCLRLNFSNSSPERITEGISRLGRLFKHALANS